MLLLLLLSACASDGSGPDPTAGWPPEKLFQEAKDSIASSNFQQAIKYFETLESRYPYGRYAQQAQLEVAYAYYRQGDQVQAVAAAERFIKLHPNHPNVDYAYYLKGLAVFNDDLGFFGDWTGQDLAERDPKAAAEAFDVFRELITRYPDSKYAADAQARMTYLMNALATYEVRVAEYYMRRGAYLAAVNRAQQAITSYPNAPARERALVLLVKGYAALNMKDLRDDADRVLQKNYPNSKYLSAEYQDGDQPWWRFW